MKRKPCFRKFPTASAILAGAFLFLIQPTLPAFAAQDPEPSSPPPAAVQEPQPSTPIATQDPPLPPTKVKKVWTNDELESSRTPMDQYLADKEAREAVAAAEAAADALPSVQVPVEIKLPATVQETQQAIDDTLQDMNDQKDAIDRLNKEFAAAPDQQKAGIQREIDRHTTGVQTSQQELKALQDHLKHVNRKSPGETLTDSAKQPLQ
jgi:hypothetical protein